jgi:hypothetical protein
MIDGNLYLAAEIIWGETFTRADHELCMPGPDGTLIWRIQADGTFEPGGAE